MLTSRSIVAGLGRRAVKVTEPSRLSSRQRTRGQEARRLLEGATRPRHGPIARSADACFSMAFAGWQGDTLWV
jgi:hypothetical protein